MKRIESFKRTVAEVLGHGMRQDRYAAKFDIFIEALVLLNVIAIVLESFDEIDQMYMLEFDIFEAFTVIVFTLEFLGRMWVADLRYPAKYKWQAYRKFLLTPMAWIDLLAIIPFFIPFIITADLRHIRILRIMRLLRVFNLSKYSQSLRLINRIVIEKKQELMATLLLFSSVLIVSATIIFWLEKDIQPDKFPSILHACWWAVITLTTIGYGDVYPMTGYGQLLGGIVGIIGVIITAIPVGIISSGFVQKMEETQYRKRISIARKKLRDAYYKMYIPEIACKVRRGQLSVDSVKVNLELLEEDMYKIAEGNNEFRFRYKKVMNHGRIVDKLFLEYREINTKYGTFTNRNHRLVMVSPDSLSKQSIGYFAYCMSEKLKCNYISNEFFGDEAEVIEESFGDKGVDPRGAFNFRHNKAYLQKVEDEVPSAFYQWQNDLEKLKSEKSIYLVFSTFESESQDIGYVHLTYLKRKNLKTDTLEYSYSEAEKLEEFTTGLAQKAKSKWGKDVKVTQNGNAFSIKENNIILYINETIKADVMVININKEFLLNEKLFSLVAIMSESIKEELIGL
ncbi:MAG: ion transporter [Opitutaceae bacterium]|nr:ion transporter [Cytophagales bacterium]